jgi:6-phosphogluconolactonase
VLYAVSETDTAPGQQGLVMAFAADGGGTLTALGAQPSGGAAPCHVSVDPSGARVFVANYHGASVAALPLDRKGHLQPPSSIGRHYGASVHPVRQRKSYAHAIVPAPAALAAATSGAAVDTTRPASFALAADLGADRVMAYRVDDAGGQLTPHDAGMIVAAPGAGPRHLAFTLAGDALLVINELDSTVASYAWDAIGGTLERLGDPISTLPAGFSGENTTAEIAVHPNGGFVYGSNRGHDSIAIFRIDSGADHRLRLSRIDVHATHGRTPRHFAIDPSGAFLIAANQESDTLVVFRIDGDTGLLTDTTMRATVAAPACVRFR